LCAAGYGVSFGIDENVLKLIVVVIAQHCSNIEIDGIITE
jgi:phage shock protein PspC (stress-responsive transcriptional regulator)